MAAIIASLKNLCRVELSDSVLIDHAINSIGLEELIEQAEAGDKDAEKRVRSLAAFCLTSDEFAPLRGYAERVFEELNKGLPDPNRPDGGSPPSTYREKLWIAHWVHKEKKRGKSQSQACSAFVEFISTKCRESEESLSLDGVTQNRACEALMQRSHEKCRKGKEPLSPEQVRKIYVGVKPDIEALYEEMPKIKATVIPIRCID
jgi:hypothetical protein